VPAIGPYVGACSHREELPVAALGLSRGGPLAVVLTASAVLQFLEQRELGEVYFSRSARPVTVRSHISDERFYGRGAEVLFGLSEREGRRIYIQSRFWASRPLGLPLQLATAQAWFYPSYRIIVICQVVVGPPDMSEEPRENPLLRSLWMRYEAFLAEPFPNLEQLMTTWEDDYQRPVWEAFLSAVGYRQTSLTTFVKRAKRQRASASDDTPTPGAGAAPPARAAPPHGSSR
jgi:hypothetical protein